MFNIKNADAEYKNWIRLSRALCECNNNEFVAHTYRSILGRDPEPSILESDPLESSEFYSDRASYLFSVLLSAESISKNGEYNTILDKLVSALGYKASRKVISGILSEYYPTMETLKECSAEIIEVIAANTELFMTRIASGSLTGSIDGVDGNGPDILARIRHLTDITGRLSDDIKHISWSLADLKLNMNVERSNLNIQGDLKSYLDVIVTMLERK